MAYTPYMEMRLDNTMVSSYSMGGSADASFDFKATEGAEAVGTPLASVTDLIIDPFNNNAGDGDTDGRDFLIWQKSYGASPDSGGANFVFCDGSVRTLDGQDDPNLLLPAVSAPKLLLSYTDFDIA
jgi:prepilin-type processing-associated H-X9-DG protein